MIWMVLALILAGCGGGAREKASGGEETYGSQGPRGQCVTDGDCGPLEGCHKGICIPFAPEGALFSVIVEPEPGSGLVSDQFVNVPVGGKGTVDLTVSSPVEIRGVVAMPKGKPSGPSFAPEGLELISGTLIATAPGLIPGTQLRAEAAVRASSAAEDGSTFSILLLPDVTYTMTFIPDPRPGAGVLAYLPTHTFSARFSGPESSFTVLLPSEEEYLASVVTGVVFFDDEGKSPVARARVSAVGDGMKGSVAVTDSKGVFSLVLPPGTHSVTLLIEPTSESLPFPARKFIYENGPSELLAQATPRFVVGPVPALRDILIQVYGQEGDHLQTVPLARLEANGVAGKGVGAALSFTDSSGVAKMTLFEGVYSLSVIPPTGSRFASTVVTLDLVSEGQKNVFHVQVFPRVMVKGKTVRASDGAAVGGVAVTFQSNRIKVFESSQVVAPDLSISTVSDEGGNFLVYLDEGVYAVSAIPPLTSGLARFSEPSLNVSGEVEVDVSVPLPEATLVRGLITSEGDGSPVRGAQVRFYFSVKDGVARGYDGASFASSVLLAGSGVTEGDGRFSVIVPRVLEGASGKGGFGLPGIEVAPGHR